MGQRTDAVDRAFVALPDVFLRAFAIRWRLDTGREHVSGNRPAGRGRVYDFDRVQRFRVAVAFVATLQRHSDCVLDADFVRSGDLGFRTAFPTATGDAVGLVSRGFAFFSR